LSNVHERNLSALKKRKRQFSKWRRPIMNNEEDGDNPRWVKMFDHFWYWLTYVVLVQ